MPLLAGDCEPPHLEVAKTVSPETICLNNQATVTLNVTGAGSPAEEHFSLDVMLIIDRSGSMQGQKLTAAKAAAKIFVGLLNATNDRSGLVSYDTTATLNHNLTFNQSAINISIDSLSVGLYTNIADGIDKANTELIGHGRVRPPTIYAEILLSDGQANRPSGNATGAALAKAREAANHTIVIYTIGLGTDADNATMQNIANITGGKYYYAPNSTTLGGIYQEIAGELSNIAGTNVVVTEVLPNGVNYVNGTAVPPPNSTSGQTLTWNWSSIIIGGTRTMTFNVTFDYPGYQLVDVYPDTRVNYTDYQGNPAGKAFPETNITVTAKPIADFSANNTSPCVNTPVQFTDNSTGNPTNWTWNFPGGSPSNSTGVGPQTVTYNAAGNYTVSLNVTNKCGSNTTTKTNYIVVNAKPTASASSNSPVCEGSTINLTGSPDGMTIYNWTGPDGWTSYMQNPTRENATLAMAGDYTLTVTNANGCIASYNMTVTISYCPDLTVLEKSEGWISYQGKTFNVTFTICNNGTAEAAASTANITTDDGGNATASTPSLAPDTCNTSTVGPFTMIGDSVNVTVCADYLNEIAESNEDNNCKVNTFTLPFIPNISVVKTVSPTSIYSGAQVTYTYNVTNTGDVNLTDINVTDNRGLTPIYQSGGDGDDVLNPGESWIYTATANPTSTVTNIGNVTGIDPCGGQVSDTANATVTVTTSPGGGGGGGGGGSCYLDIDMLGKITRVKISCVTGITLKPAVAPDFNNTNLLEIDSDTRVICDDTNKAPTALVMRVAKESPPVPDGSALVSPVYNFTGNYTSSSCGNHNALQCCSGVTFDQNITIVLNYDPDELPEFIASLAVAYYDTEQGIWVGLSPDIGRVAEIGKATGLINHFSTVAIIAELAPPPTQASFVASGLNIEQSPLVWKNIFVGVTGEDVTITANVANNGGQEGTYPAELKLNGKTVDTKEVTLAAGQSQQVSSTVSGIDYGQYKVEVAGLSGEFTVSRNINWWLIIGIILAVGLITWAAIWWRKRRKKAAQPAQSE